MALLERVGRGVRLTEADAAWPGTPTRSSCGWRPPRRTSRASRARRPGRCASRLQTAAVALVVPALTGLEHEHPGIEGEIADREAEVSLPELRLGDHDLVVVEEYEHAPRRLDAALERQELGRDQLLVACPRRIPRRRASGSSCASSRPSRG